MPLGCLEIDGDRPLGAVEHGEVERVGVGHAQLAAARRGLSPAPGRSTFNASAPHVGEELRAGAPTARG